MAIPRSSHPWFLIPRSTLSFGCIVRLAYLSIDPAYNSSRRCKDLGASRMQPSGDRRGARRFSPALLANNLAVSINARIYTAYIVSHSAYTCTHEARVGCTGGNNDDTIPVSCASARQTKRSFPFPHSPCINGVAKICDDLSCKSKSKMWNMVLSFETSLSRKISSEICRVHVYRDNSRQTCQNAIFAKTRPHTKRFFTYFCM